MRTGQLGADETDVAHGSMSTHARLANSGRNWFGHPQMTTGAIGAQAEVALLEAVFHLAAVEAHLDAAASSARISPIPRYNLASARSSAEVEASSTHLTRENKIAPTSFFARPMKHSG